MSLCSCAGLCRNRGPSAASGRLSNCSAELKANGVTRSQCGAMKRCTDPVSLVSGCQRVGSVTLLAQVLVAAGRQNGIAPLTEA